MTKHLSQIKNQVPVKMLYNQDKISQMAQMDQMALINKLMSQMTKITSQMTQLVDQIQEQPT